MKRIAIHSVPRSGSSWLGQIFNSSPVVVYKFQPLFSYAFKARLDGTSSRQDIVRFFEEIAECDDEFLDQTESTRKGIYPRFSKTGQPEFIVYKEVRYHHLLEHLLQEDRELTIVGLIRNPLAVLASWKNAPREFLPEWDFSKEWRNAPRKNGNRPEEFFGFRKWKELAVTFVGLESRFPEQFILVRYDELLAHPHKTVQRLFEVCEIPFASQTKRFLDESKQRNQADVYSVYKTKQDDNDWSDELPATVIHEVREELAGTILETYLRAY